MTVHSAHTIYRIEPAIHVVWSPLHTGVDRCHGGGRLYCSFISFLPFWMESGSVCVRPSQVAAEATDHECALIVPSASSPEITLYPSST